LATCTDYLALEKQPALSSGYVGFNADLVFVNPTTTASMPAPDVVADVPFVDPYPSDWEYLLIGGVTCTVSYAVQGASMPATSATFIQSQLQWTPGHATDISPLLSAVRNVTVNGQDASLTPSGTLSGVGTTPTVAWMWPTQGQVADLFVVIYELRQSGGFASLKESGSVNTGDTGANSLQIPSGMLQSGKTYVLLLQAQDKTDSSLGSLSIVMTRPFST
jgi:hypothetical protein